MADEKFYAFPSNKLEALTMLYLNGKDTSNMSPEELITEYYSVYDRIKKSNTELYNARNKFYSED